MATPRIRPRPAPVKQGEDDPICTVAALAMAAWTAPRAFVFAEEVTPLKLLKTIHLKDIIRAAAI